MKVTLYMATTANGYIAKENDDTSWISNEEWSSYSEFIQKAGNLIIGHRTYDILIKQPEFIELEKVKIIIVSNSEFKTLAPHHIVAKTPKEALGLLNNFEEIAIAGGSILNMAFLQEGLIDEVYIDVEPIFLGKGIPLFNQEDFECKLTLLGQKRLSEDVIQLHYKVRK